MNSCCLRMCFAVGLLAQVTGCGVARDLKSSLVGHWDDILNFDQEHFSSKITKHDSESDLPQYEVVYKGDYAVDGSKLSRHVTGVSIKPLTVEIVKSFNESRECGVSNWVLGEFSEARDLTCDTLFIHWVPRDRVESFSLAQDHLSIHGMELTRTGI